MVLLHCIQNVNLKNALINVLMHLLLEEDTDLVDVPRLVPNQVPHLHPPGSSAPHSHGVSPSPSRIRCTRIVL